MSSATTAIATTALAFTLMSCGSGDTDGAPPKADVASSPSPSVFVSERHSYHLDVPTGWEVTEYDGTWTSFAQFSPGAEVPGEDVVSSPDRAAFLVSNSMAVPDGMSRRDWLDELDRLVGSGPDPSCRKSTDTDAVAGEPARITEHRCEDMVLVGWSLVHADRGYYFTIGVPSGDSSTEATLEGIVSSIAFADQ